MSKTTFMGYVPSLKEKHESKIVGSKAIESKGGSIRYTLQGEYEGRNTLPKTVSKADFEGIYGFDAKEAEAVIIVGKDTVGSPSPASVEPPAPTKDPFPQEPSNASFSAEYTEEELLRANRETLDGIFIERMNDRGETDEFIKSWYDMDADSDESLGEIVAAHEPEDLIEYILRNPQLEDPFPQEPSNASFSAESNVRVFVVSSVDYETDGQDLDLRQDFTFALDKDDIGDTTDMQEIADEIIDDISDETGFLVNGFYFQEKMPDGTLVDLNAEAYEAFGFGKKDEEAEPKTQEFTVVMQEGDKLELTDIEDDEPKEEDNDSNEEKEAESNQDIKWGDVKEMDNSKCPFCFRSAFRLIDEEGEEFSVYEEDIAGDNWLLECSRCKAEWNQDGENTLDGGYTGNAEYEAVSAKVTRPVKEEEEETEEGLSTLAKVGIGLGALAVGALVLGAEEDEGESDYWTGDSASWRAEYVSGAKTFGAFSIDEDDEGKIHIENKCDGCGKEFHLTQNTNIIGGNWAGAIVYENLDGITGHDYPEYSPYGDLLCKSCWKEEAENDWENFYGAEEDDFQRYNRGQGQYDAEIFEARLKNQKVFCKEHGMWYKLNHQTGLNQLTRGTGCEGCINKHKGKKAETFEPSKFGYPLGVEPSRWDFGDETSATRWRKSQGKTKTHKIVRIPLTGMDIPAFFRVQKKAENFSAEGDGLKAFAKKIETEKKKLIKKAKRSGFYENFGNKETRKLADSIPRTLSYSEQDQYFNLVDNFSMWAMNLDLRELEYQSETVGTPSPSGPSSTPEPAEATGSEPSNETFEAESGSKNLKMALGITAVGIGLAAVLGKDKITKLFDKLGL